jgi:hypothetical protein
MTPTKTAAKTRHRTNSLRRPAPFLPTANVAAYNCVGFGPPVIDIVGNFVIGIVRLYVGVGNRMEDIENRGERVYIWDVEEFRKRM